MTPTEVGLTALVNGHGVTGIGNEQALQVDGYYDPVWSPDGTKIIAGREFLDDDGTFTRGLRHGRRRRQRPGLGSRPHEEHQPDWGTAPLQ